jgi:hypothetical protein
MPTKKSPDYRRNRVHQKNQLLEGILELIPEVKEARAKNDLSREWLQKELQLDAKIAELLGIGGKRGVDVLRQNKPCRHQDGSRDLSCDLEEGRYLHLRIDLASSLEQIRREVETTLLRFHKVVGQLPRLTIGNKIRQATEVKAMLKAYDLVEKYHDQKNPALKATWEIYPDTKDKHPSLDPDVDAHFKNVKRWHRTISEIIKEAQVMFLAKSLPLV